MKKTVPALIAAVLVTVILGSGMFLIGQNATAKAAAANTVSVSVDTVQQYEQLVAQVAQYQARETQYQAEIQQATTQINSANQQITTANQQIQQYQSLLAQLQNSGLITVANDGTVTINRSANQPGFLSFFSDHNDGDGH